MSAVTIGKYATHLVPEETINQCLLSSTAIALACAMMEKGKESYVFVMQKDLATMKDQLKGVMATQTGLKAKDVTLFFSSPEEGSKHRQPFPILFNADNKPSAVAFLENIETPETVVEEDLIPLIQEQFDAAGMDIPKLVERIKTGKSKSFNGALNQLMGDKGIVTMHFSNGEVAHFHMPDAGGEDAEWGWKTKASAEEAPAVEEEPITTTEPELTEEQKLEKLLAGEDEDAEVVVEPAKKPGQGTTEASPRKLNEAGKTGVPQGGTKDDNYERWVPTAGMRSKDFVKAVMKKTDKVPPQAWEDYQKGKFFLMVPKVTVLKDLKELKNSTAVVQPVADKEVVNPLPEKKVTPLPLPDVPQHVVQELQATFLKDRPVALLDVNGEGIHDPALLKDAEAKRDDFAKQLGLPGMPSTFHWTYEDRLKLAKRSNGPEVMAIYSTWLTWELIKAHQKLQRRDAAGTNTVSTATDQAERRRLAKLAATSGDRKVA